jgi:hypothetical protein
MTRSHPVLRFGTAVAIGLALTVAATGAVLAHPASEGDHPSGCIVTVEPGSVAVGQQFTVAGNFGGASIFLVEGADGTVAEGAEPDATTPAGSSFSVTFTAEPSDVGEWTVVGLLPESECGDADALTVTASPNTAVPAPFAAVPLGLALLALALTVGVYRLDNVRRRINH